MAINRIVTNYSMASVTEQLEHFITRNVRIQETHFCYFCCTDYHTHLHFSGASGLKYEN